VHRISQTGHNLGTLTGGSIAVLHHGDPLGNCAIFLHTVRPVGETIWSRQQAIRMFRAEAQPPMECWRGTGADSIRIDEV